MEKGYEYPENISKDEQYCLPSSVAANLFNLSLIKENSNVS